MREEGETKKVERKRHRVPSLSQCLCSLASAAVSINSRATRSASNALSRSVSHIRAPSLRSLSLSRFLVLPGLPHGRGERELPVERAGESAGCERSNERDCHKTHCEARERDRERKKEKE